MLQTRRSSDRGHADHGWLTSRHTFSFANYQDPNFMGFRDLRVINEDRVQPGKGFGTHPHRDMEILSYVISGSLEHRDSLGNGSVIRPGDVQRMSAGTGVTHSEYNHSQTEPVHFLQIWLLPERSGIAPGYEQVLFSDDDKRNCLRLIASRNGRDGSVTVHQDVSVYASVLESDRRVEQPIAQGRYGWLQVIKGAVQIDQELLRAGDGAAITGPDAAVLTATEDSELLLFDLA